MNDNFLVTGMLILSVKKARCEARLSSDVSVNREPEQGGAEFGAW